MSAPAEIHFPGPGRASGDELHVHPGLTAHNPVRRLRLAQDPEVVSPSGRPIPLDVVRGYALLAAKQATLEHQEDDAWFARVDGFPGAWAYEPTPYRSVEVLQEVLFDWVLLKLEDGDADLPVVGGLDLNRY